MPDTQTRKSADEALASCERRSGLPLFIVFLLYLIVVFIEMLPGIKIGPALMILDGAFWLVFVIDCVWRVFFLAPHRWAYAHTGVAVDSSLTRDRERRRARTSAQV